MRSDDPVEIKAFTVKRTTIKTTRGEFGEARAAGTLSDEYDVWLSDMDGTTVILALDGSAIDPYAVPEEADLLALIEPILREIPSWRIEQYSTSRRMEEE